MDEGPSVKIFSCPRCGAQHRDEFSECPDCGGRLELSGVGERATLPSHASAEAKPAEETESGEPGARQDSGVPNPDLTETLVQQAPPPSAPPEESDDHPPTGRDMSMAMGEWKLTDEGDSVGPAAPDPLIGLVVADRYRIVECIGRGGMGVVYKVEHTEIGKLLALKLLAGELSRQKEVVRRFKREALLASHLTHPNSVQVFDFGVSDGLTYLVMELVVGRDLSRIIRASPLQSPQLTKIMVQVCSSLAEAHGIGIVHRDLKPENIVVAKTKDGGDFAKVLDFGLAKLREAPELNAVTGTGQIVGTPFYMAPEQIHGNPVDGRSDIYGLGAVMYEALTGETVFRGSCPMAVFTKHLTEDPVPPRARAPNHMISPAMEDIVLRCLEKSPERRFQRVEDLQVALVEHLGGQSGVDSLLNASRLLAMQANLLSGDSGRPDGMSRTLVHGEVATRDEVTAFKRKMARQRWVSLGVAAVVAGGVAYGGLWAYQRATAEPPFAGLEKEPNDQASEANHVPFGRSVRGFLGKRIDVDRSDRDFYRIALPSSEAVVSVSMTALPNIASCLWVYREGEVEPRARYCTGAPGKDLSIPALHMDPGPYLFAVMQDRAAYDERGRPFVLENVSDAYELTVSGATPDKATESEPNDEEAVATPVPIDGTVTGRFDWVGDTDVVCAWPKDASESGRARLEVVDADERARDLGAVLELVYVIDGSKGASLRVHRPGARGEPTDTDAISPWRSEPFDVSLADEHCVRLRLSGDPWAGPEAPVTPPVSPERWKVSVIKVEQ